MVSEPEEDLLWWGIMIQAVLLFSHAFIAFFSLRKKKLKNVET